MRSGREHLAWILAVEVRQGTLGVDGRGWGPAGNTGRGWSWLRSGREHWAWMVAVEVRQGTLGGDGRGWGPAGNTGMDDRGWGPAGNTGRGWSWLRSVREHWAWMIVVEVRQRTLWIAVDEEEENEAGGGRRQEAAEGRRRQAGRQAGRQEATDIKSNNPHLAGGEKWKKDSLFIRFISQPQILVGHGRAIPETRSHPRLCAMTKLWHLGLLWTSPWGSQGDFHPDPWWHWRYCDRFLVPWYLLDCPGISDLNRSQQISTVWHLRASGRVAAHRWDFAQHQQSKPWNTCLTRSQHWGYQHHQSILDLSRFPIRASVVLP